MTSWQDIIIMICNLIFSISLLPQIYLGFKQRKGFINHATTIPTFLGVFVISLAYFSLNLYFSSAMAFLSGVMWFTLFLQRVFFKKA